MGFLYDKIYWSSKCKYLIYLIEIKVWFNLNFVGVGRKIYGLGFCGLFGRWFFNYIDIRKYRFFE